MNTLKEVIIRILYASQKSFAKDIHRELSERGYDRSTRLVYLYLKELTDESLLVTSGERPHYFSPAPDIQVHGEFAFIKRTNAPQRRKPFTKNRNAAPLQLELISRESQGSFALESGVSA